NAPVCVLGNIERANAKKWTTLAKMSNGRKDSNWVQRAKRFLKRHRVQVLLGEYLHESLPWLDVAQELNIRFFAHAHGYDVSEKLREHRWRDLYRRYNEAEGIITMSHVNRARLIDLGLRPDKVHVIPYGVDVPDGYTRRPEQTFVRCVAVGRMVAKKGP